jgi:hypothetical protein
MKNMKTTSLKLFQPATLAALAIITLWGVSIRPAQAGYTVTLQEVGTDVVATGSGAIDLNGLTFLAPAQFVALFLRDKDRCIFLMISRLVYDSHHHIFSASRIG